MSTPATLNARKLNQNHDFSILKSIIWQKSYIVTAQTVWLLLLCELYCWSTARLSHLTCLLLGPYVFGVGLVSFLLSKEYWVFEHQLTQFISFWLVVYTIVRFYGAKIKKFLDNYDEACTVRQN